MFDVRTGFQIMPACGSSTNLGKQIRIRRSEMGLSRTRMATLSGLSWQTANQVESGSVPDLGLNNVERLAQTLGLQLCVDTQRPRADSRSRLSSLAPGAATASVSYKTLITSADLESILVTGKLPERYIPHVFAFLDDAPVSLLAVVAEDIRGETNIGREVILKNYRRFA